MKGTTVGAVELCDLTFKKLRSSFIQGNLLL